MCATPREPTPFPVSSPPSKPSGAWPIGIRTCISRHRRRLSSRWCPNGDFDGLAWVGTGMGSIAEGYVSGTEPHLGVECVSLPVRILGHSGSPFFPTNWPSSTQGKYGCFPRGAQSKSCNRDVACHHHLPSFSPPTYVRSSGSLAMVR